MTFARQLVERVSSWDKGAQIFLSLNLQLVSETEKRVRKCFVALEGRAERERIQWRLDRWGSKCSNSGGT